MSPFVVVRLSTADVTCPSQLIPGLAAKLARRHQDDSEQRQNQKTSCHFDSSLYFGT